MKRLITLLVVTILAFSLIAAKPLPTRVVDVTPDVGTYGQTVTATILVTNDINRLRATESLWVLNTCVLDSTGLPVLRERQGAVPEIEGFQYEVFRIVETPSWQGVGDLTCTLVVETFDSYSAKGFIPIRDSQYTYKVDGL